MFTGMAVGMGLLLIGLTLSVAVNLIWPDQGKLPVEYLFSGKEAARRGLQRINDTQRSYATGSDLATLLMLAGAVCIIVSSIIIALSGT